MLITICRILLFLVLSTINFEYLINRQSNWLLFLLAIVIELVLIYLLIYPLIKKLIKK